MPSFFNRRKWTSGRHRPAQLPRSAGRIESRSWSWRQVVGALVERGGLRNPDDALINETLQLLAEGIQEGFALYGPDDRLIVANEEYLRLHPTTRDIIKPGMPFEKLVRTNIERRAIADAIGNEEEHIAERLAQHRDPKGTILRRLVDGTAYFIRERRLPDGSTIVTETDVSELIIAKETLQQREKQYRELAQIASDWFWEMDADLRFTASSTLPTAAFNMPLDKIIGRPPWELAGADPANDPHWAKHKEDLEARRPFRDFRFKSTFGRKPDDAKNCENSQENGRHDQLRFRWYSVSGRPRYDGMGRFAGYHGTARDVTETMLAENRALEAHQRLLDAIEALPESFLLFDNKDCLVLCNSATYTKEPWQDCAPTPGQTFEDFIRQLAHSGQYVAARGREEEWVRESMENHRKLSILAEHLRADGRWILVSKRRTAEGGTLIIRSDITDRKRAEIERERALLRTEEANRAKSSFLANMSHELRTPLNAIIGMTEMMSREIFGPVGDPHYVDYVESIGKAGRHLLGLVNDVLDISRIEAGRYELNLEPFDFTDVVVEAVRLAKQQTDASEPNIVIEMEQERLPVCSDMRAIRQILLNLLGNAVKFSPPDTRITVTARKKDDTFIEFAVADSGPGIPQEDLHRVTKPFEQSQSNAYVSQKKGAGLGLAISSTLAERLGGTLSVESELGAGTTVTVRFPEGISAVPDGATPVARQPAAAIAGAADRRAARLPRNPAR